MSVFYSDLCSGLSYSFNPGCCPNMGSLCPWAGATMWQVEGWEAGCGVQKSASLTLHRGPDSPSKILSVRSRSRLETWPLGRRENQQGLMRVARA